MIYEEAMMMGDEGWGVEGRLTTYAGTGIGLVKEVKSAEEIVREVRDGTRDVLGKLSGTFVTGKL
jgi:nitronate monooxygenase